MAATRVVTVDVVPAVVAGAAIMVADVATDAVSLPVVATADAAVVVVGVVSVVS